MEYNTTDPSNTPMLLKAINEITSLIMTRKRKGSIKTYVHFRIFDKISYLAILIVH